VKRVASARTLRIQRFPEPMPSWKRMRSSPRRCAASPCAGRGRSREAGPHALGEDRHLRVELTPVGGEELHDEVLDPAVGQLGDAIDQSRRLADEGVPGAGGRPRGLAGTEHADVVARRERRRRCASADLAEQRDLPPAGSQLLRRAIDRMPGHAELDGPAKRGT
jgi:hypothetical protein